MNGMNGWLRSAPAWALGSVFALGACAPAPEEAETTGEETVAEVPAGGPAESFPEHGRLVFENDYVRVIEFSLEPGQEIPKHPGLKRAVYSLSGYRLEWTEGANTTTVEWSAGEAHWHEALEHAAKNIGETAARYVTVARKATALPEPKVSGGPALSEVQPEGVRVALDNDDVQVLEVTLAPGAKQPVHSGSHRFVYSLGDYKLRFTCGEESEETPFSAGDGHWHEAGEHCAENVGDTTARYVVFGLKR
jgi:quercetin dioxygenase-like cupin family protein